MKTFNYIGEPCLCAPESLTLSLLPVNDVREHILAENALSLRRAQLVGDVVFGPLIVLVDQFVAEAVIYFLQSVAELLHRYRDRIQLARILSITICV